ncbi:neprilysin-like [Dermacentor andersoni]|uniref:neprilysin-like n=1 Tax=Dermacentor andersoni TaxID=34620 RepID=UPI003B3AEC50
MDPSHAHRSPSRQRPQRTAAHYLVPGTVTDQTVAAGSMGQSTDGIPKGDDAHYAPDLQQWRWPSRASAHSGSPRQPSATRADFPREDQQTAPHADVWAQSKRSPVGSPSLMQSPERRVTIDPSAKMELAKNKQLDGVFQLASADAEPVAGPQFRGPVPHQVIRWPSVRSADKEAAARRRSVAEQLLMSSPSGPVSPIDHGPLEMAAGIASSRRQSMMVQAAIQDLPKFSEAGAKQKRRASMDYRARALQKREQHSPQTRVPSVSPGHYAELELERRRLDKLQSRLSGCRRHKKRLVFAAMGVLLLLVVIYLVLRARTSLEDGVCSSDDCLDHAHQLLQSLDTAADPCTRFHAYVCGANRSRPDAQVAESLPYAKLVVSSVVSAATTSAPPAADGHYPATSKALTALSTCLDARATETAEHFVRFMEARGMRWPSVDSGAQVGIIGVFDVLLDLVVNWRVVLWFDAKLVYLTEDRLPVVAFEEPGALPLLRMRQVSLLDDVAYGRAVGSVSLFLTNGTTELKNSAIQELHKDEGAIRDAVLSTRTDEHDILLPLHKAHQLYVHNASLNEWRAVIAKHVKSTPLVSIETKILIMKQYSFSRLSNLLETISPARLLNVIGWMFAYVYVWMLNADFLSLGGRTAENAGAGTHCFLAVHESFGIVQASTIFHALFDTEARKEYIWTLFNSTSRALLGQLQASESITNLTKKEAALKIGSHMRAQLFPALPFMTAEQLDGLYSIFPDNYGKDATFFEMWLKSKQALQLALYSPFHDNLLTARYRWQSGSAIYLYSVNLVWLAVLAVLPPSYLTRGSPIMTYSGLGYQFARQLVRVVDERGRKLDYTGSEIPWWEQQGKCALDRAATKREMKEVADLFALDVALAALKSSAASSHEGGLSTLGIKLLEMFSPLQTFYISYCSHFCDDPVEGPVMCNLAVNASDFAEAFGCQRQSPPTCLFA